MENVQFSKFRTAERILDRSYRDGHGLRLYGIIGGRFLRMASHGVDRPSPAASKVQVTDKASKKTSF